MGEPHHDKPRPDSAQVLEWRVRGAYPNCVHLLMVTYSVGGPPQTHPDQSQSHKHQYTRWVLLELPRNVVERGQEGAKCIHRHIFNISTIFNNISEYPNALLLNSQYPQQVAGHSSHVQRKQLCQGYPKR